MHEASRERSTESGLVSRNDAGMAVSMEFIHFLVCVRIGGPPIGSRLRLGHSRPLSHSCLPRYAAYVTDETALSGNVVPAEVIERIL